MRKDEEGRDWDVQNAIESLAQKKTRFSPSPELISRNMCSIIIKIEICED